MVLHFSINQDLITIVLGGSFTITTTSIVAPSTARWYKLVNKCVYTTTVDLVDGGDGWEVGDVTFCTYQWCYLSYV